ncbi:hypothetical protein KL86DES1_20097 [uncultured Desulfovibrio sp.]|uniref:Uncharacterized protein n=2 Tax=Desulfovibrio TaxID=872 RepID=A0A212L277_9BACT|nr:hypothetical protein KL86DES1_20097 [uncultured Desulfovibrio sp.]VZH32997.1 conserved protein of unknown function [Desulfovibrio sp. 86]
MTGERGGLALHYLRLVDYVSPRWIGWGNVPGVLSSNGGDEALPSLSTHWANSGMGGPTECWTHNMQCGDVNYTISIVSL